MEVEPVVPTELAVVGIVAGAQTRRRSNAVFYFSHFLTFAQICTRPSASSSATSLRASRASWCRR